MHYLLIFRLRGLKGEDKDYGKLISKPAFGSGKGSARKTFFSVGRDSVCVCYTKATLVRRGQRSS